MQEAFKRCQFRMRRGGYRLGAKLHMDPETRRIVAEKSAIDSRRVTAALARMRLNPSTLKTLPALDLNVRAGRNGLGGSGVLCRTAR